MVSSEELKNVTESDWLPFKETYDNTTFNITITVTTIANEDSFAAIKDLNSLLFSVFHFSITNLLFF
jgi:hypothetical protein